jgi:hypothetical protein
MEALRKGSARPYLAKNCLSLRFRAKTLINPLVELR